MITHPDPPTMFDVHALIERSQPRPRGNALRWMIGGLLGGLVFALLAFGGAAQAQVASRIMLAAMLLAFIVAVVTLSLTAVRGQKVEQERLGAIEQMVTLRHWTPAAVALHGLLIEPMFSQAARVQALIYLSSVLGRYHRFSDAVDVHDYLLNNVELGAPLLFTIRVARAMALLREDRLLDADRAISELRRMSGAQDTAALALVELYRDVKTGHTQEAIEIFKAKRDTFGRQLGHRAADAYILAAVAYLMRGDEASAQKAFEDATLLAPPVELLRRYPESARLFEQFKPAPAPPEAA